MEYLISMFIDDEMDLDDKRSFVEKIRSNRSFSDETLELLEQEKIIRSDAVYQIPQLQIKAGRDWKKLLNSLVRPFGYAVTGMAVAAALMVFFMPVQKGVHVTNRFVIFRPDVNQAEIAGTFTDWNRLPMKRIGSTGYWEIKLPLPSGEHRFTYILEGNNRFADPTILNREKDDFGGENSIIHVEGSV